MFKTYVDANDFKKVKSESNKMAKKFGMSKTEVVAVDMEHSFVPTSVSQSAKGGSSNLKKTAEMNMKRFGYDK